MADAEQSLVNGVTNLSVNGNEKSKESGDEFAKSWGFQLPELYKLAVRFFKGNYCDISNYWYTKLYVHSFSASKNAPPVVNVDPAS